MGSVWRKFSIFIEVGIIVFTLFLIVVDGISLKYIVLLVGDSISLFVDLLERYER